MPVIQNKMNPVWIKGRAFVCAEHGEVEYFAYFISEKDKEKYGYADKRTLLKSECGGVRPVDECRPLDYVKP